MPEAAAGNEAVVRRFIDGWVNGGDLDVIDETWSDDMSWHGGSLGTYEGREAFKRFTAANAAGAFADMHLEIHELIAPRRPSRRPLHRQRHQHRPLPRQPAHRQTRRMARHRHLHHPRRPHHRRLVRRRHTRHADSTRSHRLARLTSALRSHQGRTTMQNARRSGDPRRTRSRNAKPKPSWIDTLLTFMVRTGSTVSASHQWHRTPNGHEFIVPTS
jgi:hypothetical protein